MVRYQFVRGQLSALFGTHNWPLTTDYSNNNHNNHPQAPIYQTFPPFFSGFSANEKAPSCVVNIDYVLQNSTIVDHLNELLISKFLLWHLTSI